MCCSRKIDGYEAKTCSLNFLDCIWNMCNRKVWLETLVFGLMGGDFGVFPWGGSFFMWGRKFLDELTVEINSLTPKQLL